MIGSMLSLFAAYGGPTSSWTIGEIAIAVVVIAAVVALVVVALRQFNVQIPAWVTQCAWILAVAFVVILCIRIVLSL